ncbi:MAG: DUF3329 domain-containing protein [Rhizobiaceae bacterium]
MDIIGAKHPFFRIPWRRYATVGASAALTVMEWAIGNSPFWAILFTGVTCLAAWELILNYKQPIDKGETDAKP